MTTTNNKYPTFNINDEEIIIIPGSHFSKIELKSRLKEMDIKDNNIQNKEYLSKLYDSSLNDYQNCLKIIQRLRKDTNSINSKFNKSQRQSMPTNFKTSYNLAESKMMNISNDIKDYYQNSREQLIKIVKPMHTNKGKYVQNPFLSSIQGQGFNNSYNNEINNKLGTYNEKSFNSKKINDINENNFNLEKNNISNINRTNNNSSFLSDDNNLFKYKSSAPNTDMNNINKSNNMSQYPPEEKIVIDEVNNNNIQNNLYNNQDYYNKSKNEKFDVNSNENNYKRPSKRLTYQTNALKNDINYVNSKNNKNRNTLTSIPHSYNINEIPYNSVMQNKLNNSPIISENNPTLLNNNDENNYIEKNEIKKDSDEVSTFSLFSAFDQFKKYPIYKNRKFILIHLLILLSILCLVISLFNVINNSWESICNIFSNILNFFSDPKYIFDTIISYISSIFLVPINYWYITIPIIILAVVFYFFIKRYLFKKRCNEILEKIVKDLLENENRAISEEDICLKYSKMFGISYNKFVKKYLPRLQKLRRNDVNNRLKLSSVNNNEKEYIFWELNE